MSPTRRAHARSAGKPVALFTWVYNLPSESGESYNVDPTTGRFLMIRLADEHAADARASFKVVVNWPSELDRIMAAAR